VCVYYCSTMSPHVSRTTIINLDVWMLFISGTKRRNVAHVTALSAAPVVS